MQNKLGTYEEPRYHAKDIVIFGRHDAELGEPGVPARGLLLDIGHVGNRDGVWHGDGCGAGGGLIDCSDVVLCGPVDSSVADEVSGGVSQSNSS